MREVFFIVIAFEKHRPQVKFNIVHGQEGEGSAWGPVRIVLYLQFFLEVVSLSLQHGSHSCGTLLPPSGVPHLVTAKCQPGTFFFSDSGGLCVSSMQEEKNTVMQENITILTLFSLY